jgi:hypothetical protein
MQTPPLQVWPAPQAWPHVPQFRPLVLVSTQLEPQRVWPVAHPHCPPAQPWPGAHAWAQAPQFCESVATATQAPEQFMSPIEQLLEQADWLHTWPAVHAF